MNASGEDEQLPRRGDFPQSCGSMHVCGPTVSGPAYTGVSRRKAVRACMDNK